MLRADPQNRPRTTGSHSSSKKSPKPCTIRSTPRKHQSTPFKSARSSHTSTQVHPPSQPSPLLPPTASTPHTSHKVPVVTASKLKIDKTNFEQLLLRKMVFVQSFEIYGGSQGLYDYGPMGDQLMSNISAEWRRQFIKQERMLGFAGSTLTPETVLKASGHVDRFTDWMTATLAPEESPDVETEAGETKRGEAKKDKKQAKKSEFVVEHLRTDKLVEEFLENFIESLEHRQKATEQAQSGDASPKLSKNSKPLPLSPSELSQLHDAQFELKQVGGMSGVELDQIIRKYGITHKGMSLTPSTPFNLMFDTLFGPSGKQKYYFRPETAQGIFVNFQRLYDQNNRQLPLSVAQIGTAYRNEISPRGTILRTREFTQAEIEHFVDPLDKRHPKFNKIGNLYANFLSAEEQVKNEAKGDSDHPVSNTSNGILMTFGEAVYGKLYDNTATQQVCKEGIVDNECLGYFLYKTQTFLTSIGIHADKIRFRQHLPTEMAHYATDCWDAEILTSNGWVECVGHADRSAYDLDVHSAATKNNLVATVHLDEPVTVVQKALIGDQGQLKTFLQTAVKSNTLPSSHFPLAMGFRQRQHSTADLQDIFDQIQTQLKEKNIDSSTDLAVSPVPLTIRLPNVVAPDGSSIILKDVPSTALQVKDVPEVIRTRTFTPHVIEPSFGFARILYSLLEHSYAAREVDEQRKVLRFTPKIAPYQLGIYTVASNLAGAEAVIDQLEQSAIEQDIAIQIDASKASIGKKYSRWDEYGVPFAITIDSSSILDPASMVNSVNNCANNPNNVTQLNDQLKSQQEQERKPTGSFPQKAMVTIRERDSCEQVRVELDTAMATVQKLVNGKLQWKDLVSQVGLVQRDGSEAL